MASAADYGPFWGRALLAAACRMRGADLLGKLKEIESAPFRSPDEIREQQFRDLRAILAHAEAHVPYYRALFRRLGMKSQDIRNGTTSAGFPS